MILVASTRRKVVQANKRWGKDASFAGFERRLFQTCTAPHPHDVDVDLTGVRAPDASTAAMLLHARSVLHQRGGELRITRCPDGFLPLLQACGLLATAAEGPGFAA
ncbi:lipid asymmetry maintenance protein MlaB [Actinoplanes sp. NPDC020271]|uniref:lipid asymmetry maintenance protein MlaB n=1 Tax=Actinoplanes sp. NPDC020271 TaxID=3363896 RepID=UPI00379EF0C1